MAADDLTTPLGLPPPPRQRRRWGWAVGAAVAVVAVAGGAALAWFSHVSGPTVTAAITTARPGGPNLADRTGTIARPAGTAAASNDDAPGLSELQPAAGGSLTEVGKVIIRDPSQPPPLALASAPQPALVEMTKDGPLPKIAADGRRPIDAYARPSDADPRDPRIAIIVGGVGLDPNSTEEAIADLPGEVTLALAPYGRTLGRTLADARTAGHEILLQIPLEPFGYPRVDPGPHTLTTDASAAKNRSRLHWLMSRITNYVGVVNYMGARFTSDTAAFTPVIEEIGRRGLLYLDDGSSARSVAATIAPGRAPFLRADLVLDVDVSAAAIDARLHQLQEIARERGYAIATATAFPVTIDRIAAFAKQAADHNTVLVPVSALVAPGRT